MSFRRSDALAKEKVLVPVIGLLFRKGDECREIDEIGRDGESGCFFLDILLELTIVSADLFKWKSQQRIR